MSSSLPQENGVGTDTEIWSAQVLHRCLEEANGDVEAGFEAAEYILKNYAPVPPPVTPLEKETIPTVGTFFSNDLANSKAQSILNRAIKASRGMTARAKRDLAKALKSEDGGRAVLDFVERYRLQLAKLLNATQLASVLEGAREVADSVPTLAEFPGAVPPPPTLEPRDAVVLVERIEALPQDQQAQAIYELPVDQQQYIQQVILQRGAGKPPDIPSFAPPSGASEGGISFPTIDEAVKSLAEKNVMTRVQFDALEASTRQKAFTVAGVGAEETLTKIRNVLAENVSEGADYEAFKSKVMDAVGAGTFLSEPHMETVFRTNVQTAFSDGQMAVLNHPLVRSGFPYSRYDSIHDDRVRPEHRAMDEHGIDGSNVYRTDDPVFQTFRPPWSYNCRCAWTPLTVRQAAEEGIPEAQEWMRTGVEPENKAFVPMPDFAPSPGFDRAIETAPLSVQLSLTRLPQSWIQQTATQPVPPPVPPPPQTGANGRSKEWVEVAGHQLLVDEKGIIASGRLRGKRLTDVQSYFLKRSGRENGQVFSIQGKDVEHTALIAGIITMLSDNIEEAKSIAKVVSEGVVQ